MSRPKAKINPIATKRLKQFIKSRGMTQGEFSKAVNYAQPTISKMICGKTAVTKDLIKSVVNKYPEINPLWLSGESEYLYSKDQREYDKLREVVVKAYEENSLWEQFLCKKDRSSHNQYAYELYLSNCGYRTKYRVLHPDESSDSHINKFFSDIISSKTGDTLVSFTVQEESDLSNEIANYAEYLITRRIEEKRLETANNSDGVENHEV